MALSYPPSLRTRDELVRSFAEKLAVSEAGRTGALETLRSEVASPVGVGDGRGHEKRERERERKRERNSYN